MGIFLTHALKFLLKLSHMFTISDSKIIIRISALINTVRRSRRAYGHDSSWSLCTLRPSNLLNGDHFRGFFFFFTKIYVYENTKNIIQILASEEEKMACVKFAWRF